MQRAQGRAGGRTGAEGLEVTDILRVDCVQHAPVRQPQLQVEARGSHEACTPEGAGGEEQSKRAQRGQRVGLSTAVAG